MHDVNDRLVHLMAMTCAVPLILFDVEGVIRAANPAAEEVTGLSADTLVGHDAWSVVATASEPGQISRRIAEGRALQPGERLYEDALGNRRRINWTFDVVPRRLSEGRWVVATGVDVTRERMAEAHWRRAAATDPLTGLQNRAALVEALTQHADENQGLGCGVLFCDLDGFKPVNDTHGHQIGDEVLVAVSKRLESAVRKGDLVARVGGDEFAVLMPAAGMIEIRALATRVEQVVQRPIPTTVGPVRIGISVGHAVIDPGGDATAALDLADRTMYQRKHARKATNRAPSVRDAARPPGAPGGGPAGAPGAGAAGAAGGAGGPVVKPPAPRRAADVGGAVRGPAR